MTLRHYRCVWSTPVTMFSDLLRRDRERYGLSPEQAARTLGVSQSVYRALEAAERRPDWETFDRIERLFGWPRTFRLDQPVHARASAPPLLPP
jgi:transcriptional regulator with XRE-family HTH domain